jgi:hypothetical protein
VEQPDKDTEVKLSQGRSFAGTRGGLYLGFGRNAAIFELLKADKAPLSS